MLHTTGNMDASSQDGNNNNTDKSTANAYPDRNSNTQAPSQSRKPQSRRSSYTQQARATKRRKSSTLQTEASDSNQIVLPLEYIECDKMELITIISRMLSSIVSINDSRTSLDVHYLNSSTLTRFHSRSPPHISIYNYLVRLSHYSSLENCVLIATVYYIDLLTIKYPSFALNSLTVHRFLLTATTIASKALCDSFCSNSHYAKVGGVNIIELNLLEVEFLKWVNYRVIPRDFNYDSICERKNSAGAVEVNQVNSLKFGISTAEAILKLYYEKMISLVGGANTNTEEKDIIHIGHKDDLVYRLEVPDDSISNMSSSSSSSDDNENDEDDDIYDYEYRLNNQTKMSEASHEDQKNGDTVESVRDNNGSRKGSLNNNSTTTTTASATTAVAGATSAFATNHFSSRQSNGAVQNDLQANSPVEPTQLNSRIPNTNSIVAAQIKSNASPNFMHSPGISTYSPV